MIDRPALLDVSVPMYAAGDPHPLKEPCAWVMREVASGQMPVVINVESVQEVLHRYTSLQRWRTARLVVESLLGSVPEVLPVPPSDLPRYIALWERYAPQGLRSRDLLHVAVMLNHDIQHIISTDRHFDRIAAVTRVDPLTLYEARGSGA